MTVANTRWETILWSSEHVRRRGTSVEKCLHLLHKERPVVRVEYFELVIPRFKRPTVRSLENEASRRERCIYAPLYFEDADEMQAVLTEVYEKVYTHIKL